MVEKNQWKRIENYLYEINKFGQIKSLKRNIILKQRTNTHGYKIVNLYCGEGRYKTMQVHRLIGIAFISNPLNKPCINHINGKKTDNRVENIEWCTYSENSQHSYDKLGRVGVWTGLFGKNHHRSKKVNQYDLNNNFIKTWDCMMDVERELGLACGNLTKVCKKEKWHKTLGGFKWKYV